MNFLVIRKSVFKLVVPISFVSKVASFFMIALVSNHATASQTDYQSITLGPAIPPDVSLTQENRQRDMDIFSWQSFIALNWPDGVQGQADPSKLIGDNTTGDHTTVWENWMSTADMFDIRAGKKPVWGQHHVPKACSQNSAYTPGMKVIDQAAKSDDFFQEAFDSGALVDQAGEFVRYEILINKPMFNTIVKNKLYSVNEKAKATSVNFSCGDNETGKQGAIMIKAAWKMISVNDDVSRFHTDEAMVFTPAKYRSDNKDSCEKKTIGLVGMHIVHKTVKQPQWIWSSFEQVDNLPACDKQNTFFTDPTNLNSPTCPSTTSEATKKYNFYSSASLNAAACNDAPKSNAGQSYYLDQPAQKSQLCRANQLETSAPPVNEAYQTLLASVNSESVWQNYELIGTQWNSNISSTCQNDTVPVASDTLPQYNLKDKVVMPLPLANSTMEGYEQGTSNCISCHSAATTTNASNVKSDFVWFLSQEVQ